MPLLWQCLYGLPDACHSCACPAHSKVWKPDEGRLSCVGARTTADHFSNTGTTRLQHQKQRRDGVCANAPNCDCSPPHRRARLDFLADDDWSYGRVGGRLGWFPTAFVELDSCHQSRTVACCEEPAAPTASVDPLADGAVGSILDEPAPAGLHASGAPVTSFSDPVPAVPAANRARHEL